MKASLSSAFRRKIAQTSYSRRFNDGNSRFYPERSGIYRITVKVDLLQHWSQWRCLDEGDVESGRELRVDRGRVRQRRYDTQGSGYVRKQEEWRVLHRE